MRGKDQSVCDCEAVKRMGGDKLLCTLPLSVHVSVRTFGPLPLYLRLA